MSTTLGVQGYPASARAPERMSHEQGSRIRLLAHYEEKLVAVEATLAGLSSELALMGAERAREFQAAKIGMRTHEAGDLCEKIARLRDTIASAADPLPA